MADQITYTCPHCGAVSNNPNDAREEYCGRCHRWARDPVLIANLLLAEMARLDELARVRTAIGILRERERYLVEVHERAPARVFVE